MKKCKIGVISDTHGLLREEVLEILKETDLIIHAGDVVDPLILEKLKETAPVIAVCGNCDKGDLAYELKKTEVIEIGKILIYVLHDINKLDINLETAGINIVISGHSHSPLKMERNGILFLNPGSVGPRRFRLPVSMAILNIDGDNINTDLINIDLEE